ncbi:MAG: helix-turn-helix transcriptional regulator [Thermoanaerobaculia bacterium]
MPSNPSADFDIGALYAALDAQRLARGLSWQQVVREINARSEHAPARSISVSTVTGMRSRAVIEGDGVLQMLLWLHRAPESFVPGYPDAAAETLALPYVGPGQILRFDLGKLYSALDAQRIERGMTWKQVASEIGGFSAASLTRLSQGRRTGFPHVMRIARWLGRPVASFTRVSNR